MRRALLALAALLALVMPAAAAQQAKATFVTNYDLDSTSYTYCVTTGQDGRAFDAPRQGAAKVSTVGSSTTVAAVTASSGPFTFVSVGDVLFFKIDNVTSTRYVTARASADSITVDTAINLSADASGYGFTFLKVVCGTTATDGWIPVTGWRFKKLVSYIEQMNTTGGIDVRFECRDLTLDTNVIQVYPASGANNYTAAGITSGIAVVLEEPWDECRIGYKITTSDDGGDTGANQEQIHAYVVVWQ